MEKIDWLFPPLASGNEMGYTNSGIETFKGVELMDNLAREICQNSLDAKDDAASGPVTVKFDLMKVNKNSYEIFEGYRKCLDGCKNYWAEEMDDKLAQFIDTAQNMLNKDEIPILVASDYNTRGLAGSRKTKGKTPWKALTHSDGVSVKKDGDSAGSYGIGKNAPFACSALSMVFYNTYSSEDKEKAFQGVARLATISDPETGKPTQGIGHYQNNGEEQWHPVFPEDNCSFRDLFKRGEFGTDIIIIGFSEEQEWKQQVKKAIVTNFFLAIYEDKLIIELPGQVINKETLIDVMDEFPYDKNVSVAKQLLAAVILPDRKEVFSILEKDDAEVYLKSDRNYGKTVANFRSTGMLVGKYRRNIYQNYAAVLVIRKPILSGLLKDTEPTRHNRWDYTIIPADSTITIDGVQYNKRGCAKEKITYLENQILQMLKEQYEPKIEKVADADVVDYLPDDGEMGENVPGDDILRVNPKVERVRKSSSVINKMQVSGKKVLGTKIDGDVHNEQDNPIPPDDEPNPRVRPDDNGETRGISAGAGSKVISVPNIRSQRAFGLADAIGLYKAVIIPEADYENIYVSFSVRGEDGKSDSIKIEHYTDAGKKTSPIASNKIGPLVLKKEETKEVFISFASRGKLVLEMNITEEKNV